LAKKSTRKTEVAPEESRDAVSPETLEDLTRQIGRTVWQHLSRRKPSIFERRWWDERILGAAMADESLKVQMFRFVDVLPRLKTHREVTRHLQEYFHEVREHLPWAVEMVRFGVEHLSPESVLSRALAYNARANALRMARRFIAGTSVQEVLSGVTALRKQGFAFTLDLLGEAVISEPEAEAYQQSYLNLLDGLAPVVNAWPEHDRLDCDHLGHVPRMNVSLKLSALVSHFRPADAVGTAAAVKERLRPLFRKARSLQAYVHVDMEQYAYKDLTLEIFRQTLMEEEFRDWADVGIVIQAYLKDADRDVTRLLEWSRDRGTPVWVRLVKGAYWDYETVNAISRNWPVPVYEQKWQSDDSYERLTRVLLENHSLLRPAFGSHNLRSLSHALACAEALRVPERSFELQMLYGMAEEQARVFSELGHRVRVYTPFGQLIPGMAYLVRRLLENTSNDSFLRHSYDDNVQIEDLLMKPSDAAALSKPRVVTLPEFRNEPTADFSQEETREQMLDALGRVYDELGEEYAIIIGGKSIHARPLMVSRNPSHKDQVVGRVASATTDDVEAAVESARRAFPQWSRTEVQYRAEYLELIAREIRERRFELAAWEVYECGKPWAEADADVCEAIDFCMYYAQQMRQLDTPQHFDLPGEENRYFYRPRGVAVVIAPWNFPLAILAGMTTAALVSGNTVIMKPAEQSSVVAAKFMEVILAAGVPDGVVNFLPGIGEEIGPLLVGSPDVDVVAFTGSRAVGLAINEQAAAVHGSQLSIKHVLAEMGGKNAIIVDSDADLDEAVVGVIQSAFGYSGQKCSACSRVIVLSDAYDEFVKRLVEATRSLKVGPAEDPSSDLGPVIDEESATRILRAIEDAESNDGCQLVLGGVDPKRAAEGFYVGPHIFVNVPPDSPLAQQEIFGPVLAVFSARDLSEALTLANQTDYALTGGCYSRSPANLKRVRSEFAVGNLYLNRPITGALVGRQPFGGFRLSGIGSKAGGPDYLKHFLIPINVTENTLRRGFAPETSE